jgi:hypothetical protein
MCDRKQGPAPATGTVEETVVHGQSLEARRAWEQIETAVLPFFSRNLEFE